MIRTPSPAQIAIPINSSVSTSQATATRADRPNELPPERANVVDTQPRLRVEVVDAAYSSSSPENEPNLGYPSTGPYLREEVHRERYVDRIVLGAVLPVLRNLSVTYPAQVLKGRDVVACR